MRTPPNKRIQHTVGATLRRGAPRAADARRSGPSTETRNHGNKKIRCRRGPKGIEESGRGEPSGPPVALAAGGGIRHRIEDDSTRNKIGPVGELVTTNTTPNKVLYPTGAGVEWAPAGKRRSFDGPLSRGHARW